MRRWVPHTQVLACGGFDSSFIFFSPDDLLSRPTSAKLNLSVESTSLTPAHHGSLITLLS